MRAARKTETSEAEKRGEVAMPAVEMYTAERIAEFLLSNSVDAADYARAVEQVKAMGLDPDSILHIKPQ